MIFQKLISPSHSLYAEFVGLTTTEKIADTKYLLSSDTTVYEVKGGNHAQLGMYGTQDRNGKATLSAKEQQDELVKETLKWLNHYQR